MFLFIFIFILFHFIFRELWANPCLSTAAPGATQPQQRLDERWVAPIGGVPWLRDAPRGETHRRRATQPAAAVAVGDAALKYRIRFMTRWFVIADSTTLCIRNAAPTKWDRCSAGRGSGAAP